MCAAYHAFTIISVKRSPTRSNAAAQTSRLARLLLPFNAKYAPRKPVSEYRRTPTLKRRTPRREKKKRKVLGLLSHTSVCSATTNTRVLHGLACSHLPEKLKLDGSATHVAYSSGLFLIMSSFNLPCLRGGGGVREGGGRLLTGESGRGRLLSRSRTVDLLSTRNGQPGLVSKPGWMPSNSELRYLFSTSFVSYGVAGLGRL